MCARPRARRAHPPAAAAAQALETVALNDATAHARISVRKDRAGEYESSKLIEARAKEQADGKYQDKNEPPPAKEDPDGPLYNLAAQENKADSGVSIDAGQHAHLDVPVYRLSGASTGTARPTSLTPSLRSSGSAPPQYAPPPDFSSKDGAIAEGGAPRAPVSAPGDGDGDGDGTRARPTAWDVAGAANEPAGDGTRPTVFWDAGQHPPAPTFSAVPATLPWKLMKTEKPPEIDPWVSMKRRPIYRTQVCKRLPGGELGFVAVKPKGGEPYVKITHMDLPSQVKNGDIILGIKGTAATTKNVEQLLKKAGRTGAGFTIDIIRFMEEVSVRVPAVLGTSPQDVLYVWQPWIRALPPLSRTPLRLPVACSTCLFLPACPSLSRSLSLSPPPPHPPSPVPSSAPPSRPVFWGHCWG